MIITKDKWIAQNNNFDNPDSQFVNLKPYQLSSVNYFGTYPPFYDKKLDMDIKIRMLANKANNGIKPDGTMFALGYEYTDRIQIFDSYGRRQVCITGPDQLDPIISENSDKRWQPVVLYGKTFHAYSAVVATDEGLWAGYSNRTEPDKAPPNMRMYDKDINPNYFTKILKFNWNGELLKVYELDEPVFEFEVNSDNNSIYGLTNYNDNGIVEFTLD